MFGHILLFYLPARPMTSAPENEGRTGLLFGVAAALTLDEFALWFTFRDVYWQREGRLSIDAVLLFGSLLSTPIVNPPQSGVLGMHTIQDRPVAYQGSITIRPMMYVALTYDHRIVDGREAVTFLKRIKDVVEQPSRLLIEI